MYLSNKCTIYSETIICFLYSTPTRLWAGKLSRYNDWLWAGWSGDRIPMGARVSAPVQTGSGARSVSSTMGTGSFPGVKSGRDVTLTPHPLLVPWALKGRAIPLLPLRAVRPVQCLSACTKVHFIFSAPTCSDVYISSSGSLLLCT